LSAKANLKREGYPLLRMNNLVDGLVDTSDLKHIQLDKKELEKFRLNKGDVLFNRTNSSELVGKTGLFDKEGDYVFASYLIRLVTDFQLLNPYFLSFYFNWETTQTALKRLSFRGAGQSNISASKLEIFKIPLPSFFEQQEIAEILQACDTKIAALEQETALLGELFHAMLDELMTGNRSAVPLIDREE
jgi:type I restriction enzyme S subunit